MTLILHAGATPATYDELRAVEMPDPTDTHVPIAHHEIVEQVRYALGFFQHEIVEETHALMPDGMNYFGVMTLRSPYGDYRDIVGLRNSHIKKFPIGIAFGSRVTVCDNTAFIGDHVIKRKHTANARRELPGLVSDIVRPLQDHRVAQNQKLLAYQKTPIGDATADHLIMQLYRRDVIGVQRIADVNQEWQRPSHDWGDKSLWRLFNAVTFALAGKVAERPKLTQELHTVIDGAFEVLH